MMIRIQMKLPEEQYQRLKRLSIRRGQSLAALVRQGVEKVLQDAEDPDMDEIRKHALSIVGKYSSGISDVSVNHDKYLTEIYRS